MMRSLFDVNVLIALLDTDHFHHQAARQWLRDNTQTGWATCPITQNGCMRVMAQTSYPNGLPAALVAERLCEATATNHHEFWADDVSLLDSSTMEWRRIIGSRQITDIYLACAGGEATGPVCHF
ncbi:TA system VapC family ribonuclease toxin [Candidatus Rariloculus sp.]|uniref:TA system VapC family ribonuclease toxin n=1 Tax=Candidatus Rariloculus sp. TaxID=3101265 RepID=UPI003D14D506